MMRAIQLAVACVTVLVATAGQVQAGVIISPRSIIRNDFGFFSGFYPATNIINQGALNSPFTSGVTDYGTYVGTTPTHGSNNDSPQWFGSRGLNGQGFIDFDLGASYDIDRLAFWSNPFRANRSTDVFTSNDPLFGSSTLVGNFRGFYNDNPNLDAAVQDIDLVDSTARYVRFDISSFNTTIAGIGEVAFSVGAANPVPEPSSLAIFGMGACVAGIGAARRRRPERQQEATA